MPHDRAALGESLRSRRDRLSPAQAGIGPFPGPRRVPGLRKEELAVLAGVSADYYSRLEQGRQANVSVEILDALARALRLDDVERAHLRNLAAPAAPRRGHVAESPQRADPGLLRIMTELEHVPVLLLGHRGDVLARNALLPAVLGRQLETGTSFTRFLFLDTLARERIRNWEVFARAAVAALRLEAGRRPHDRTLHRLIDQLRAADPDVSAWWDDHAVRDYASVTKHIRHPEAGDLTFGIEVVSAPNNPDQRLTIYTVEPDSPTARVLPMLMSWGNEHATQHRGAAPAADLPSDQTKNKPHSPPVKDSPPGTSGIPLGVADPHSPTRVAAKDSMPAGGSAGGPSDACRAPVASSKELFVYAAGRSSMGRRRRVGVVIAGGS